MTHSTPDPATDPSKNTADNSSYVPPTPGRCFRGSVISGGFTFVMYLLNQSIIRALADTPLPTKSVAAANIAVAVRTLVIGVSTLSTAIFAIATLGLLALGIQLLIQRKPTD